MGLFLCHLPVVSAKEIESVRDRYEVYIMSEVLIVTQPRTTIETICYA